MGALQKLVKVNWGGWGAGREVSRLQSTFQGLPREGREKAFPFPRGHMTINLLAQLLATGTARGWGGGGRTTTKYLHRASQPLA